MGKATRVQRRANQAGGDPVTRSALVAMGIALVAASASGCASDDIDIQAVGRLDYGGHIERIETLGRYSATDATLLFNAAGARAKTAARNDYYLYRVAYPTLDIRGAATTVSGLVAIPVTRHIKGIVSWQHGTNTYRPESISKPSVPEGLGVAALFAADGFILAAPDYIGLGVSTDPQGYYHWPSTVSTVLDLVTVAEIMLDGVAESPDHDLYLAGFSQGGGASAAVHRALERANSTLVLRATATIAAAFNPLAISFPNVMKRSDTFYLALVATAFSHVYAGALSDVVRAPYDSLLSSWLDGTKDGPFLKAHIPDRVEELLTDKFLADYSAGIAAPTWFYDGLAAADTSDFPPQAPLRMFFGSEDTIVIPEEARAAFTRMRALGGNVELFEVGGDHEDVVIATLPHVQAWFDVVDGQRP